MFNLIFIIVIIESFGYSQNNIDPCINFTYIGNENRHPSSKANRTSPIMNDNDLNESQWVSFGSERLKEGCVFETSCSTQAPLYLNGSHPTNDIITELPFCGTINERCCAYSDNISVKLCSQPQPFYVYKLKTTTKNSRYCSEPYTISSCFANFSATFKEPVIIKEIPSQNSQQAKMTVFGLPLEITIINNPLNSFLKLDVSFMADNKTFYSDSFNIEPGRSTYTYRLDERFLKFSDGKTALGWNITANVKINKCNQNFVKSNSVWLGLYLVNEENQRISVIRMLSNESAYFRVAANFPIGFIHCEKVTPCVRVVTIGITSLLNKINTCSTTFSATKNVTDLVHMTPIFFESHTQAVGRVMINVFEVPMESLFYGIKDLDIPIVIDDQKSRLTCNVRSSSTIEPFISLLQKFVMRNNISGDYYLFQSTELLIDIQIRQVICQEPEWPMSIMCTCGVMVREGNNIFGINGCNTMNSPFIVRPLTDSEFPGGAIDFTRSPGKITLLQGVEITVEMRQSPINTWVMDIELTGISTNKPTEGICTATSKMNSIEKYRVPESESLFILSKSQNHCKPLIPDLQTCKCVGQDKPSGLQVMCDSNLTNFQMNPAFALFPLPSSSCPPDYMSKKIKRDAYSKNPVLLLYENVSKIFPLKAEHVSFQYSFQIKPIKRVSFAEAPSLCEEKLKTSKIYSLCKNILDEDYLFGLSECINDVQAWGSTDALLISDLRIQKFCKFNLLNNQTSLDDVQLNKIIMNLNDFSCPGSCNGHGTCKNGQCFCEGSWANSDCSRSIDSVPAIMHLIKLNCSTNISKCNYVYLTVFNLSDVSKVYCRIQTQIGGNLDVRSAYSVSFQIVICEIPKIFDERSTFLVSVGNDDRTFSNAVQFCIYAECPMSTCSIMPENHSQLDRCANPEPFSTVILITIIVGPTVVVICIVMLGVFCWKQNQSIRSKRNKDPSNTERRENSSSVSDNSNDITCDYVDSNTTSGPSENLKVLKYIKKRCKQNSSSDSGSFDSSKCQENSSSVFGSLDNSNDVTCDYMDSNSTSGPSENLKCQENSSSVFGSLDNSNDLTCDYMDSNSTSGPSENLK